MRAHALAPVLLLVGCAAAAGDAGFHDVRAEVLRRTGKEVRWNAGRSPDEDVARAVDALLARPLEVEDAVQVALLENRALQARYAALGLARAELLEAGLLRNPVLELGVRHPAAGGRPDLDAEIVTDVLRLILLPRRLQVADARVEAAELEAAGAVVELAAESREAFVDYQAALALVDLREQLAQASDAAFTVAEALHRAGNLTDLDLHRERANRGESLLRLSEARLAEAGARERLNVAMGLWGPRLAWTAAGRLPPVPSETLELGDLESRAVAASLDLARQRRRIEVEAYAWGAEDAARLLSGELDLGAGAEREDGDWKVGPSIGLPIPLFDQGQGRLARAQARLRREVDTYHALAVEVRAAARAAAQAFLTARSRAIFLREEVVPTHARAVADAQLQFDAMQIGVFRLLEERERSVDAQLESVEAQRDYWLARARLRQLFEGGLPRAGGRTGDRLEEERDHESPEEAE